MEKKKSRFYFSHLSFINHYSNCNCCQNFTL